MIGVLNKNQKQFPKAILKAIFIITLLFSFKIESIS